MPLFFCLYSKFFESPYHCFLSYIPSDVDIFTFIERRSELCGVFLVWRNDSWLKKCIQYCLTRLSYSSLTFILWTGLQLASQIFLSRPICFPRNASLRLICPAAADWKKNALPQRKWHYSEGWTYWRKCVTVFEVSFAQATLSDCQSTFPSTLGSSSMSASTLPCSRSPPWS